MGNRGSPNRTAVRGRYDMNRYANLSKEQRRVQQIIDQFNADEQLWESLGSKRRRRRKLHPGMPAKVRKQLDLLEFAAARPAQDCIAFPQEKDSEQ
jgi:hypothetical protein